DSDIALWLQEKVILCEQPGKEHPIPVLVGNLLQKVVDLLSLAAAVSIIAKLARMGAEADTQVTKVPGHSLVWFCLMNRKSLKRLPGPVFGNVPPGDDSLLEKLS